MSALSEQQNRFGDALLMPADTGSAAFWGHFIEAPERAQTRIAAYQRNVRGNWRVALAASFPVIATLLGQARCRALADHYIAAHPSNNADLNRFGERFSGFVAGHPVAQELPYLPDLARLEWALEVAYGDVDEPPLDLAKLAAVPPGQQGEVVLVLSARALEIFSPWPIFSIWQAHQQGDLAQRDAALATIDLTPAQHRILVSRNSADEVRPYLLSPGEAAFRAACLSCATLHTALDQALDTEPTLDVASLLSTWRVRGWIVDVILPNGVLP